MRALWTAASGMKAQQLNVDVISNNISNINTVGYKKQRAEFKDMLYSNLERVTIDPGNGPDGSSVQVGHGVRPSAISKLYSNGALYKTDNVLDVALDGRGFLAVDAGDETLYTRDGSLKTSVMPNGSQALTTQDGHYILDIENQPIIIPNNVPSHKITIDEQGNVGYINETGNSIDLNQRLQIVQFDNSGGLESVGTNFTRPTAVSGDPIIEVSGVDTPTKVVQGFLEASNVEIADEMVNLIIAQRAYDMNSKAVQTADQMMEIANNLRR